MQPGDPGYVSSSGLRVARDETSGWWEVSSPPCHSGSDEEYIAGGATTEEALRELDQFMAELAHARQALLNGAELHDLRDSWHAEADRRYVAAYAENNQTTAQTLDIGPDVKRERSYMRVPTASFSRAPKRYEVLWLRNVETGQGSVGHVEATEDEGHALVRPHCGWHN